MTLFVNYVRKALEAVEMFSGNPDFNFANSAFPRMVKDNQNNPAKLFDLFDVAEEFMQQNPDAFATKQLKAMYPEKFS